MNYFHLDIILVEDSCVSGDRQVFFFWSTCYPITFPSQVRHVLITCSSRVRHVSIGRIPLHASGHAPYVHVHCLDEKDFDCIVSFCRNWMCFLKLDCHDSLRNSPDRFSSQVCQCCCRQLVPPKAAASRIGKIEFTVFLSLELFDRFQNKVWNRKRTGTSKYFLVFACVYWNIVNSKGVFKCI